jgi:hypothetical protein
MITTARRGWAAALATAVVVGLVPASASADRLVVRFEPGADRGELRRDADARVVHAISADLQVLSTDDAGAALRSLRAEEDVE